MTNLSFFPHDLGGKNSPFILTIDEWNTFSNCLNTCVSAPTTTDELKSQLYQAMQADDCVEEFQPGWDGLVENPKFNEWIDQVLAINAKVKKDCTFWKNDGRPPLLSVAEGIVNYANLICNDHYQEIEQVIQEMENGGVSPETKSKFLTICQDLSNQASSYYQQTQSLNEGISNFYKDMQDCQTKFNDSIALAIQAQEDIIGPEETDVFHYTNSCLSDLNYTMVIHQVEILSIIQKVHGIWDAISSDLKGIVSDIEENIGNIDEFIASLDLETAVEDWKAVHNEAEDFYKNASTTF